MFPFSTTLSISPWQHVLIRYISCVSKSTWSLNPTVVVAAGLDCKCSNHNEPLFHSFIVNKLRFTRQWMVVDCFSVVSPFSLSLHPQSTLFHIYICSQYNSHPIISSLPFSLSALFVCPLILSISVSFFILDETMGK